MSTVVLFKCDLRLRDHGPLYHAAKLGEPVIPLYVIEPEYWQLPDTSQRQWRFIEESLAELHWREPALHFAKLFTDFEPGIHYPQVQMQSGLTDINALNENQLSLFDG